jgi:hypothetical protein
MLAIRGPDFAKKNLPTLQIFDCQSLVFNSRVQHFLNDFGRIRHYKSFLAYAVLSSWIFGNFSVNTKFIIAGLLLFSDIDNGYG